MRKRLCLAAAILLVTADVICTAQQTEPVGKIASEKSENTFLRDNPEYRDRAGKYYEKEYLEKATHQLAEVVKIADKQKPKAGEILKSFIYDWLGRFVEGGGRISRKDLTQCLSSMDKRFQGELSEAEYEKYLTWRKGKAGANALGFLMDPKIGSGQPEDIPAGINNVRNIDILFVEMSRNNCSSRLIKEIHVDISSVNFFFKGNGLEAKPLGKKDHEPFMVIPVDTDPYKYKKGEWNKIYLLADNTIVNVFYSKKEGNMIVSKILLGTRGLGLTEIINWPEKGREVVSTTTPDSHQSIWVYH